MRWIVDGFELELVSEELNHLAAILHVYAGGFDFYEVKKKLYFQKENGNTLTLLIIILVKSIQKEQIAQITQYDPWSAGTNLQSTQRDLTPQILTLCPNQSKKHTKKRQR